MTYNDQNIIPLFTTPKRMLDDNFKLHLFSIRKNIDALIMFGKDIIINPSIDSELQFYIPYKNIKKIIRSYAKKENKRIKKYEF